MTTKKPAPYTFTLPVEIRKGGGMRQLCDDFEVALYGSGVRIQPGVYDITITRRPRPSRTAPAGRTRLRKE